MKTTQIVSKQKRAEETRQKTFIHVLSKILIRDLLLKIIFRKQLKTEETRTKAKRLSDVAHLFALKCTFAHQTHPPEKRDYACSLLRLNRILN